MTHGADAGTLSEQFARYLVAGATGSNASALAEALRGAGLGMEADLLGRYADTGLPGWIEHAGRPTYVGPRPPAAARLGERWFDTCELSLMMLLPFPADASEPKLFAEARVWIEESCAWFALQPVRAFQYRGFMAAAPLDGTFAADCASSELDAIVGVTCDQAGAYLHWFGKYFPNETHWQSVRDYLRAPPWGTPAREWLGESSFDETLVVALSPDTIESDPEEIPEMLYPRTAAPDDVTFRSAVLMRYGLRTENVASCDGWGANVRGRLPRPAF